jgi:hypothetical protein
MVPVVNRHDSPARRLDLNRAKPILRPARLPLRESDQFFKPRTTPSNPVLNASLEHSRHHGATCGFA